MVGNGYDGLSRWVERGIDERSPPANGVDVYQRFFCGDGWEAAETL